MIMQSTIEELLMKNFTPLHLKVINESHLHEGHQDFENPTETHFKIIIASKSFEGKSKIMRHRDIYRVLEKCFRDGLHALSIEDHTHKPNGSW